MKKVMENMKFEKIKNISLLNTKVINLSCLLITGNKSTVDTKSRSV